jgi:hypothetical protein
MIVDQSYRDNVGYIVAKGPGDDGCEVSAPIGTVFFLTVQIGDIGVYYAVTCAHVINHMGQDPAPSLHIRVNTRDGAYCEVPSPPAEWKLSKDSDVAIARVKFGRDVKIWAYPIMEHGYYFNQPSLGQSVFMTGLFIPVPGEKCVEALVRSGTVAREIAEVPVIVNTSTKETKTVKACLIQATAWGGESGSPVFVYEPEAHIADGWGDTAYVSSSARVEVRINPTLIGLLHGHFPIPEEDTNPNSGIAVVIPRQKIVELLCCDELTEERQNLAEAEAKRSAPPVIPDSSK